jgi:hypothetical protein
MNFQKPAYLSQLSHKAVNAAALAGATPRPPRVSIYGNRFTLIHSDGTKTPASNPLQLDCIVVSVNPRKTRFYYEGKFDAEDSQGPLCQSGDGITPSQFAHEAQAKTCDGCAHAVWGSLVTEAGVARTACAEYKHIAILIPGETEPYLFGVPAGSTKKKWVPYTQYVESNQADLIQVVTRITVGPAPGELNFAFAGFVPEAAVPMILGLDEDHLNRLVSIVDERYRPMGTPALPPPVKQTALPPANAFAVQQAVQGEAPKKRGRPVGSVKAAPQPVQAELPWGAPPEVQPVTQAVNFGMVDAVEPDADLAAKLNAAFNLEV